jgi:hypothetical protein
MAISKIFIAIGAASLIAICFAALPPIPQDPLYHAFADRRIFFGVPNFWNVISNIPFFIAAIWGLRALRTRNAFTEAWERVAYCILLAGTAMVGFGSTYYHLHPDDSRLFWDRVPMTVVFMSLVATTIGERVNSNTGKLMLLPLILAGIGSVLYWRSSGDLRPYVVVQFGSLLAMPVLLLLFPPRYSASNWIWGTLLLYAIAKVMEVFDQGIATVIPTGGHPWKHLAAVGAVLLYNAGVAHRKPLHR